MKLKGRLQIIIMIYILIFQNLKLRNFAARLAEANLATKRDITNFANKTDFDEKLNNIDKKVTWNKTKDLLVKNKFKKLQRFDSSLFIGKNYSNNDGPQLFLIFQSISIFPGLQHTISEWESKGLSNDRTRPSYKASKSLSLRLAWYNSGVRLKFTGSCSNKIKQLLLQKM